MPAKRRRAWRNAAAVLAPLTAGAVAIGPVPAAGAAQPEQFSRRAERTVSVRLYTGEQLTCRVLTSLNRWQDPEAEAHALVSVYGDDGCQDQVLLTASVQYESPSGDVLWSRASTNTGSIVSASAEPVRTVIRGHYDIRFGLCDEAANCVFQYEIAAPK
jgi:hypothetical protein